MEGHRQIPVTPSITCPDFAVHSILRLALLWVGSGADDGRGLAQLNWLDAILSCLVLFDSFEPFMALSLWALQPLLSEIHFFLLTPFWFSASIFYPNIEEGEGKPWVQDRDTTELKSHLKSLWALIPNLEHAEGRFVDAVPAITRKAFGKKYCRDAGEDIWKSLCSEEHKPPHCQASGS